MNLDGAPSWTCVNCNILNLQSLGTCSECKQECSQGQVTSALPANNLSSSLSSHTSAPSLPVEPPVMPVPPPTVLSRSVSHAAPETALQLSEIVHASISADGFHVQDMNACTFVVPSWLDPDWVGNISREKAVLRHSERTKADWPVANLRSFIMNHLLELDLLRTASSVAYPFGGVSRLLPLSTSPDGNCLLHSISLAMWGIHDRSGFLRGALHRLMSAKDHPMTIQLRALYGEQEILNQASRMVASNPGDVTMQQAVTFVKEALDPLGDWEPMVEESSKDHSQCVSVHIFVLAHVLKRPILVHGPDQLPNNINGEMEPNTMRGIYLPLLCPPAECVREPLTVYFARNHFTALCRIDDQEPTPGLVQLDFIQSIPIRDAYGFTGQYERRHVPLPLLYNCVARTGFTDEQQLQRYLDLQTVWAGLPNSLQTFYLQVARCQPRQTYWEIAHPNGATSATADAASTIEPTASSIVPMLFAQHWQDFLKRAPAQFEQYQHEQDLKEVKQAEERDKLKQERMKRIAEKEAEIDRLKRESCQKAVDVSFDQSEDEKGEFSTIQQSSEAAEAPTESDSDDFFINQSQTVRRQFHSSFGLDFDDDYGDNKRE